MHRLHRALRTNRWQTQLYFIHTKGSRTTAAAAAELSNTPAAHLPSVLGNTGARCSEIILALCAVCVLARARGVRQSQSRARAAFLALLIQAREREALLGLLAQQTVRQPIATVLW